MVQLWCAIIGAAGRVFSVNIGEYKDEYVGDLMEMIHEEKSNIIKCNAEDLKLFLPKTAGGWLTFAGLAAVRLNDAGAPVGRDANGNLLEFEMMNPLLYIRNDKYFGTNFTPGQDEVHVLVVIPSTLRIGVDNKFADKIRSYMAIADRLKNSEEVKSLSRYLASVMEEGKEQKVPTPFVVLESSSGMGKTQMAFNLQARGEYEVFYIVCGNPGDREQSVYDAYAERSRTFNACIHSDLEALRRGTLVSQDALGAVGQIRGNTTLALYGFILAALRATDQFSGEAQRSDVINELNRRENCGEKPFVFFLDEFPRAGRTKTHLDGKAQRELENSLRTMRNVFRSFGLAVVASSTNGTARNLLVTSDRSRDSGPCLWCVVVPSFPRVNVDGDSGAPSLVMEIIKHSRPLFAEIAVKYVQDNPCTGSLNVYLNAMAGDLAPKFGLLKKQEDEFEIGQLCLLLCTSYQVMDDKVNIIDSHFARLLERSAFELSLDSDGRLRKGQDTWTCRCVLPSPEEDILLHLTMTGGPLFRPFRQPLRTVMSNIKSQFHYDNTEQRSNDGMRLEALTAAAIVLASHAGGFGGVTFPAFLSELLFELDVSGQGMAVLPEDVKIGGWGTSIVPFLSPPNEVWPEWLKSNSSMRFDNFIRTRNEDRIDFRTASNLISGECKDYSGNLSLGVVKDILERAPTESAIHLVVTNTLQGKCFTAESSWETFARERSLQYVDFYRVSKGSTLQEIEGMSTRRSRAKATMATRLVLFVELG